MSAAIFAGVPPTSDLDTLIAAERRLDRALDEARANAASTIEAARREADEIRKSLAVDVESRRQRLVDESASDVATQLRELEASTAARVAHFESIRGERLDRIADALVDRLAAIVREET